MKIIKFLYTSSFRNKYFNLKPSYTVMLETLRIFKLKSSIRMQCNIELYKYKTKTSKIRM